jgi:hypothetical protein
MLKHMRIILLEKKEKKTIKMLHQRVLELYVFVKRVKQERHNFSINLLQ